MAYFAGLLHEKRLSNEFFDAVQRLKKLKISEDDKIMVDILNRDLIKARKLPREFVEEIARVTTLANSSWKEARENNRHWSARLDPTIMAQAEAFIEILNGNKPEFIPEQAEDYCFARTFGYMTRGEAGKKWPNLAGHETNRFEEMEKSLDELIQFFFLQHHCKPWKCQCE